MTLKINRVPDYHKDEVSTKFGQNPLKDVDSRVLQGCYGRTDGSVTVSLRNFVGEGIIRSLVFNVCDIEGVLIQYYVIRK